MNVELIIIGILTGFISAFFGIGGSSIDTPILRAFLNFPPHIALGTPLPLTILIAASALSVYKKEHIIDLRIAQLTLTGGIPAVLIGSYLSKFISGKILMLLTSLILFLIGAHFVYRRFYRKQDSIKITLMEKREYYFLYPIGIAAIVGLISGILANGGGIFFVPAYVLFFRMDIKQAIATSLLSVSIMALPCCLVHYCLGHMDLKSTAALAVGAVPMAFLGAKLDLRTRSKTLELLFGITLIVFSIYFFLDQLDS